MPQTAKIDLELTYEGLKEKIKIKVRDGYVI